MAVRKDEDGRGGKTPPLPSSLSPEGAREGRDVVPFVPERADKAYRPRHDGFTPERQKKFFKTLRKTGCISDAARAAGISRNTVRRWRDRWEEFDGKVEAALAIASVDLDTVAWKRATEGAEEKVFREGRLVATRIKPSDSILRLIMQGANPGKYGRMGKMPKRALVKKLRKEVEAEFRARMEVSEEELLDALLRQFDALGRRLAARDAAAEKARALAPAPDIGDAAGRREE